MIDQIQTGGPNHELVFNSNLSKGFNMSDSLIPSSSLNDSENTKFNHQRSPSNVSNTSHNSYLDSGFNLTPNKLNPAPAMSSNHQAQLSINSLTSVNSIIEPITPPSNPNPNSNTRSNSSAHPSNDHTTHLSSGCDIDKDYLLSVNKVPLSQLKPEILKLAKDQYGCRFLQKKIDENLISNYSIRFANFEIIFNEIYLNLYELIIDPFGNYLIQKLIKYCSNENLNLILEILQSNLFQISINQHGTRALQKIIENLNSNYQLNLLIQGLKPFIIELIKDLNGNHVIQKILNKFKPVQCQFIYDSILSDLATVATHKHGCCVLQKCLNHVTQSQLNQFVDEILSDKNFDKLINDQFGNYVLQYLISINNYQIHYKFFSNLIKFDLVHYCNLKFSSNVIEKFIKNCYNNEFSHYKPDINFINLKYELIYQILKNFNSLNKLINDPFGNYVIQTLIDNSVNPKVDYIELKPKKLYCLINPLPMNNESIKFEIINNYFNNCKILSSFGKRIQLKISLILSNQKQNHFASRTNFSSSSNNIENNGSSNVNNVSYYSNNLNSNSNVGGHSASNSFGPTRSNSYPGGVQGHGNGGGATTSVVISAAQTGSNGLQYNPAATNYVLDNQLQTNFSNMNLNYDYNLHPQHNVQTTPTQQPTPGFNGPSPVSVQNPMGFNSAGSAATTPLVNTPQTPSTAQLGNQNSYFMNYPINNTPNLNAGLNYNTNLNMNMNQNYLKTPQIFSNAPGNEFINDSNQNFGYYR